MSEMFILFKLSNVSNLLFVKMVSGIYEDCDVRLTEFEETGRTVLRVIIPDKHNRFPEDPGCDVRYTPQIFTTDFIYREGD